MKKNFIKKLAFVMASALVVTGAAPAAQAGAALKDVKLNANSKNLYLNADNQTGTSNKFNFDYKNLGKKADYTVKWSVEDKSVVKLAKGGVVTAKKVGTTSVYCKITKKSTGKSVTLEATVNVKANAASVAITNVPENNTMLVGVANDFNRTMKSAEGKKATDKTAWEIVGENTAGASVDSKGVVTATKTGEFTLKASTYQSKATKANPTATDEVTIKVVTDTKEAKQTTLNKFDLTFLSDVSKTVKAEDITVARVVGTTEVKQVVKSVTFNADGTVATVELHNDFVDGQKYTVKVKDMTTPQEINATVGEVASIAINTTNIVFGSAQDVVVKLYNAAGVDITTSTLLDRVDLTSDKGYMDSYAKKLTLFQEGDVATVKAVFHTYKYDDNGAEIPVETTTVITAVKELEIQLGNVIATSITDTGSADWNNPTNKLAAEDNNYQLYVKVKNNKNEEVTSGFTFKSTDENVLIVSSTGVLYPIKAGVVNVLVYSGDTVVDAVEVSISAKREIASLDITGSAEVSNSTNILGESQTTVAVKVKDQLGKEVTDATITVDPLGTARDNGDILTFDGVNYAAGRYQYKVTATKNGKSLSKVFTLVVKAPSQATATYWRASLDKNNVDMKLDANNLAASKNITLKVLGYAPNGVETEIATTSAFTYTIAGPNGYSDEGSFNGTTGTITIKPVTIGANNVYDKMDTGSYQITVKKDGVVLHQVGFTLTDSQVAPIVTKVNKITSTLSGSAILAADEATTTQFINDTFVISLNGKVVTDTDSTVVTDGFKTVLGTRLGTSLHVKSVVYREKIGTEAFIEHTVNIGQTITVAAE